MTQASSLANFWGKSLLGSSRSKGPRMDGALPFVVQDKEAGEAGTG